MDVVFFVIAIVLVLVVLILMVWQFAVINCNLKAIRKENSLYQYEMMFMYRMDYDLFETYSLTHLPTKQKMTHRYSNLIILDIFKKIGISVIMVTNLCVNDPPPVD